MAQPFSTPSPTGKKPPHCRTCGSPMKGHGKGQCGSAGKASGSGKNFAQMQAQHGTAGVATIRPIMPGSYGADRPSEVSVGPQTLLERIGPKLEETPFYVQSNGYANDYTHSHEDDQQSVGGGDNSLLRRLMPQPTLLTDEIGPEHSISQVYQRQQPSTSNPNPNYPNQSLATLATSFSSWVAPPSPTHSSISFSSLTPPEAPRPLPLNELLKVANAKPNVIVIELEHKFVRPVTKAANQAGVYVACIERADDGDEVGNAFYAREPPNVRMVLSRDAEAVARYRSSYEATRNQRSLFEVHDYAIERIQGEQMKLAKELNEVKRRTCGMGFCSMISAGAVGALVLLFVISYG